MTHNLPATTDREILTKEEQRNRISVNQSLNNVWEFLDSNHMPKMNSLLRWQDLPLKKNLTDVSLMSNLLEISTLELLDSDNYIYQEETTINAH